MAPVLALSGFMGSGKTAVGRRVAEWAGWRFVDLDEEVERAAGRSIAELFAEGGEPAFRELESLVLARLLREAETSDEGVVLALGGGTVTWPASADVLADAATVVRLDAPPDLQWRRAAGTGRPLAGSRHAFGALREARREAYASTADAVVDTDGLGVEEAAAAVIAAARGTGMCLHQPGPEAAG